MAAKDVNKTEKDQLTQAENLKARVISALRTGDVSSARDYVDEYLSIVDLALDIWKMNKSLLDLQVRGRAYRWSMGMFYDESQLKQILNEIESLIILLRNIK